ncbi:MULTISPECIES: serine hydrolase domain-containing protein [unclassified Arthrobacter]|uniref:serine hydrolase domain-containing protein n=1 Tax=unclassified Arthrobacter TaxID=235627 RepID=UPI001E44C8D6|nr:MULTISPECIES: serine hydrolase domain-containing protein [unclassified Arthrobacter]MCC9145933.1 beta-lactamase family protein [Arthrobacter sp. zg-Y919]MDK1277162.1 serine hydrolase domain-containing protein [Arthrobacter sp. zg.Y919]WIB03679.1 serine hydrolase domain-containing protein [Arthrobacter sp. zg-Y919]
MSAIHGTVTEQFMPVRDAFAAAFEGKPRMGAALAVHHQGQLVVDLWGGVADARSSSPWTSDTSTVVFSCTKGIMSLLIARLVEAGQLDYDMLLTDIWPEFGAHGKGAVTVGDALAHRAGVSALRTPVGLAEALDWQTMTGLLAEQEPLWEPGSGYGYHALTHGWLSGEIVRRVTGQMPGTFLAETLANPLGADLHLGVPVEQQTNIAHSEAAESLLESVRAQQAASWPGEPDWPSAAMTLGHAFPQELVGPDAGFNRPDVRAAEFPGAGGVATARGLSAAWSSAIHDTAATRRLDPVVLKRATEVRSEGAPVFPAPAPWPRWGAGFQLDSGARRYVSADGFGHDGAGGQVAFAEPGLDLSMAFITNWMEFGDDDRATRIVDELRKVMER